MAEILRWTQAEDFYVKCYVSFKDDNRRLIQPNNINENEKNKWNEWRN